jgi:hypothetical protein
LRRQYEFVNTEIGHADRLDTGKRVGAPDAWLSIDASSIPTDLSITTRINTLAHVLSVSIVPALSSFFELIRVHAPVYIVVSLNSLDYVHIQN